MKQLSQPRNRARKIWGHSFETIFLPRFMGFIFRFISLSAQGPAVLEIPLHLKTTISLISTQTPHQLHPPPPHPHNHPLFLKGSWILILKSSPHPSQPTIAIILKAEDSRILIIICWISYLSILSCFTPSFDIMEWVTYQICVISVSFCISEFQLSIPVKHSNLIELWSVKFCKRQKL